MSTSATKEPFSFKQDNNGNEKKPRKPSSNRNNNGNHEQALTYAQALESGRNTARSAHRSQHKQIGSDTSSSATKPEAVKKADTSYVETVSSSTTHQNESSNDLIQE